MRGLEFIRPLLANAGNDIGRAPDRMPGFIERAGGNRDPGAFAFAFGQALQLGAQRGKLGPDGVWVER